MAGSRLREREPGAFGPRRNGFQVDRRVSRLIGHRVPPWELSAPEEAMVHSSPSVPIEFADPVDLVLARIQPRTGRRLSPRRGCFGHTPSARLRRRRREKSNV